MILNSYNNNKDTSRFQIDIVLFSIYLTSHIYPFPLLVPSDHDLAFQIAKLAKRILYTIHITRLTMAHKTTKLMC